MKYADTRNNGEIITKYFSIKSYYNLKSVTAKVRMKLGLVHNNDTNIEILEDTNDNG